MMTFLNYFNFAICVQLKSSGFLNNELNKCIITNITTCKKTPEWGKGSENNCNPSTKLHGQLINHPIFSKSYL